MLRAATSGRRTLKTRMQFCTVCGVHTLHKYQRVSILAIPFW
ncbi:hypothetical protein OKW38_004686 [Paraburkholderia sp. MM5496-R1]